MELQFVSHTKQGVQSHQEENDNDKVVFSLHNFHSSNSRDSCGPDFYRNYKNIRDGLSSFDNNNNNKKGSSTTSVITSASVNNKRHKMDNYIGRGTSSVHRQSNPQQHLDSRSHNEHDGTVTINRITRSPSRLASGFMDLPYYNSVHRQIDFMPIILVPSSISSPLQLMNIRSFVEHGNYIDPTSLFVDNETGAVYVVDVKPDTIIISPGSFIDQDKYSVAFNQFRVVDDPAQVINWSHVCACIVDGVE
uniref:Meiotic recombination protein REC8 n=1 Tax=Lygus hesperus TaxID=30085 RepID=A0A0A9ZGJ7_LYGHE